MPRRVYPDLKSFFRDNPDVTSAQIAKDVECSPAYVSMIKWRDRQPALPLALKLAARCSIPLESLVRKAS